MRRVQRFGSCCARGRAHSVPFAALLLCALCAFSRPFRFLLCLRSVTAGQHWSPLEGKCSHHRLSPRCRAVASCSVLLFQISKFLLSAFCFCFDGCFQNLFFIFTGSGTKTAPNCTWCYA